MGIFSFFDNSDNRDSGEQDAEWQQLAQHFGVPFRRAGKDYVELRGMVGPHRLSVAQSRGETRIRVWFDSGLDDLSVRSHEKNLRTSRIDVPTGDAVFDSDYRLLLKKSGAHEAALEYLTTHRRQVIHSLGSAVPLEEVKEDELEVRIRTDISSDVLHQAIEVCLLAAKALHVAAAPQDVV